MTTYRKLTEEEIDRSLFSKFRRRQVVTDCWRKIGGEWLIQEAPFIDEWSEEDYHTLVSCLRNTVRTGGLVLGAFHQGWLKGFVSVEAGLFGQEQEYLDLSSLHVSEEMRRAGIGRDLFRAAQQWAAGHGAKKLYISSHSAAETQSFYRAMGCVEAKEYHRGHEEQEPFDCQLECKVLP